MEIGELNLGRTTIWNGELVYTKHCNFNQAVLWITRELSITPIVWDKIAKEGVKKLVFINTDTKGKLKDAVWEFAFDEVNAAKKLKRIGQEPQYYFSVKKYLKD